MNKNCLCILIFCLINILCYGQSHRNMLPDSLLLPFEKNFHNDKEEFNALCNIVDYLLDTGRETDIKSYTKRINELALNNRNPYWKAAGLYYEGVSYAVNNSEMAFANFYDALQIMTDIPETNLINRLKIRIYLALSMTYYYHDLLPEAYTSIINGLEINKKIADKKLGQKLNINLACVYRSLDKPRQSLILYKEILEEDVDDKLKGYIYNNIGNYYLDDNQSDSAIMYYEIARDYLPSKTNLSALLKNMGIAYIGKEEYATARNYFKEAFALTKDSVNNSLLYVNLARIKLLEKEYDSALYFSEKGIMEAKKNRSLALERNALFVKANSLKELKRYKECSGAFSEYKNINDSIKQNKNIHSVNTLMMQQKINAKDEGFRRSLKIQEMQDRKEKTILIVIVSLIVIIILTASYVYSLIIERKNILIKNKQLKEEILRKQLELQEKELSAILFFQVQMNEILNDVISKLSVFSKDGVYHEKQIESIITDVRKSVNEYSRKDFDRYFSQVYPDFFNHILLDYPALTSNEQQLCALLRLNLPTKDVAVIMGISPDGIRSAKMRLKKKFNVQGDDDTLISFIAKF